MLISSANVDMIQNIAQLEMIDKRVALEVPPVLHWYGLPSQHKQLARDLLRFRMLIGVMFSSTI